MMVLLMGWQLSHAEGVCGATASPSTFVGKSVSFRGKILSDGMHATVIKPDDCRSEGYGVLWTGDEGDPAFIVRGAVTKIGLMGTQDKDISVDVEAMVVKLPNGKVGVKLTKLNKLVLVYPKTDTN